MMFRSQKRLRKSCLTSEQESTLDRTQKNGTLPVYVQTTQDLISRVNGNCFDWFTPRSQHRCCAYVPLWKKHLNGTVSTVCLAPRAENSNSSQTTWVKLKPNYCDSYPISNVLGPKTRTQTQTQFRPKFLLRTLPFLYLCGNVGRYVDVKHFQPYLV